MERSMADGRPFYAVPFVVDRLDIINDHLGYAMGDQLLEAFSRHLIRSMESRGKICRWSGTSLIALVDIVEPLDDVRTKMNRLAADGVDHWVRLRGQEVCIPVVASCTVFQPGKTEELESLVEELDSFVAEHLET